MSEIPDNVSAPCGVGIFKNDPESHKDCHAQMCRCDCHGGIPPICDCAEKRQEEERLADQEAETYWKARLFPELQAKYLAAVESQESWEFVDEPWIRLEPTLKAIREVTG